MLADNMKTEEQPTFEEALEKTGNGLYNVLLTATGAVSLLAIGADLFGFSLVVAAACDMELTVAEKGILTSVPFVGILLVSYFWGYVSDTKGRRYALLLSLSFGFILSSLASLSIDWISLAVLKFLSVCFSCATNSVSYTLVGESCISRIRNKYMLIMTSILIFSPGFAAFLTYPVLLLEFKVHVPLLGIVYSSWRLLDVILALPLGISAVALYFFHESPKFLANCGRTEEALEVMRSIYAVNHSCSKDDYGITSFKTTEYARKKRSLFRSIYEQSAPLFRPPYLWRTVQLYFIVSIVFVTNNSFLVWLPYILNEVKMSMDTNTTGNICDLISNGAPAPVNLTTDETSVVDISPETCVPSVDNNTIITLMVLQMLYALVNLVISYLPNHRRKMMIFNLSLSTISGFIMTITPDPISSTIIFLIFTSTCVCMGILASYFVDQYPTSYRGMVACLSIMVGRSSSFIGINIVGNVLFQHCKITFNVWSLLVLSALVASWFLPPDNPPKLEEKPTKL